MDLAGSEVSDPACTSARGPLPPWVEGPVVMSPSADAKLLPRKKLEAVDMQKWIKGVDSLSTATMTNAESHRTTHWLGDTAVRIEENDNGSRG